MNTTPAPGLKTCHCAEFEATPADLTTDQVESGDFPTWTTGCQATTRRTFAPGHDAKLKGFLIKHAAAGHDLAWFDGSVRVYSDVETIANRFPFGRLILDGVRRAADRAAAKLTRRAPDDATPPPAPLKVEARVGRWVYTGEVTPAGTFRYTSKAGEVKEADKFTRV